MEIDLQVIGIVVQIVTLKMVMAKTQAMRGMVAHAGPMTGMEVEEDQQGLREEVTGTDQDLMNAPMGQGAHLPLTDTKCFACSCVMSELLGVGVNALLRFCYF